MKDFENGLKPKIEKTSNYRANINDWAGALRDYNKDFADKIDEERAVGFKNLEKLNLPRYKNKIVALREFLENPEKNLGEMESEKFYISLMPKKENLRRIGKAGLGRKEVMDFISEYVSSENHENYEISINQFFDNIFGGSIIVDKNGLLYFEFIKGNQTPVGKGNADIEYKVWIDRFTKTLHYSFEDEAIGKVAHDAIMNVPHVGEGREIKFLKGYYELAIAKRNEKSEPETFFLDYRDNDAYLPDLSSIKFFK